jgi:hypothetical protein
LRASFSAFPEGTWAVGGAIGLIVGIIFGNLLRRRKNRDKQAA